LTDIARTIRERLAVLAPEALDLDDQSALHAGHPGAQSGGGHYRLTIVSQRFRGEPKLARHRMIYDALGELMQRDIHALSLHAVTPEEHSLLLSRKDSR
jgi:BolA family transcriptional regulator, general stress-responsive regulator